MQIIDTAVIVTAVGVLVILTNALTELFKDLLPKVPAQITATIIAVFLTVSAVFTYISVMQIPVEWYIVVGAFVAGFFVSYTAQYGYDKLKEILKLIGGKK